MPSLRDLQLRTFAALVCAEPRDDLRWLRAGRVPAEVRLKVYRNNLHETARKTLASAYPVIEQLVGPDCFRSLAKVYVERYPSRHGDLALYGQHFPRLLAHMYDDSEHPYLASVAKIEWACVECEAAPDERPFDAEELRDVEERDYPFLRFVLHPSIRIVSSDHPAFSIWRAHVEDTVTDFDIRSGAEHALIYRDGVRASVERIGPDLATFVSSLNLGDCLITAQTLALSTSPDFKTDSALVKLCAAQLVVGIEWKKTGFTVTSNREKLNAH